MRKDAHPEGRRWVRWAVEELNAEANRSADTHLIRVNLPMLKEHGVELYLKDESSHPTRSLKHRLARSLFLYGLCNGRIKEGTPVVESSSGSTAVSEAYFASLLGLRFISVVPDCTAQRKLDEIAFFGGECHAVPAATIIEHSKELAAEIGGHYVDQFTYAERATDWRGNNNIAESIFQQLSREQYPEPDYIVIGAGTGGTSATIGRFLRYRALSKATSTETQLLVPDPENSVFFDNYVTLDPNLHSSIASRIEGIGRPRVELSFVPSVIDGMLRVSDAQSMGTMVFMEKWLDRRVGASTGTNLYTSLLLAQRMIRDGRRGAIVSLICDGGERYSDTCYNAEWRAAEGIDIAPVQADLQAMIDDNEPLPTFGKCVGRRGAEMREFSI